MYIGFDVIIILSLTLHPARLAWRSVLPDFDGIVYVVDAAESTQLALSKDELHGLLNNETLSKPILILAPMSNTSSEEELRQQLNVQEVVTKVCELCRVGIEA